MLLGKLLYSQNCNTWEWVKTGSGDEHDYLGDMVSDSVGNLYAIGTFSGKYIKFDSFTIYKTSPSKFTSTVFVIKYNTDGKVIWVKSFESIYQLALQIIKYDGKKQLQIIGYFDSTTIIGKYTLNGRGSFLLTMDTSGSILNVKKIASLLLNYPNGRYCFDDLIIAGDNEMYISGSVQITINTANSFTLFNKTWVPAYTETFLVRFDSSAKIKWIKKWLSNKGARLWVGNIVRTYNGMLVYSNTFDLLDTLKIDSLFIKQKNRHESYIVEFDSTVTATKIENFTDNTRAYISKIIATKNGELIIAGQFGDTACFGNSVLIGESLINRTYNLFLTKRDALGGYLWAKHYGCEEVALPQDIEIDDYGNIYLTGFFKGLVLKFGSYGLRNYGDYDFYLFMANKFGDIKWVKGAQGPSGNTNPPEHDEYGENLCINSKNELFVAGTFEGEFLTFDSFTLYRDPKKFPRHTDLFIAKLGTFIIPDEIKTYAGCKGDSNGFVRLSLSGRNAGKYSFYWSTGDTTQSVNNLKAGKYWVIIRDTNKCFTTDTIIISDFPQPVANFTVNDSLQCFKENFFSFTNTSTISTGNLKYFWALGNGRTSSFIDESQRYLKEGEYFVSLIARSDSSCLDTQKMSVQVYIHPFASFTLDNKTECLEANSFEFKNLSTDKDTASMRFLWNFGDGTYSSNKDPVYSYQKCGIFDVALVAYNKYNCTDTFSKNLQIYCSPDVDFSINDSIQCLIDNHFVFQDISPVIDTPKSYIWECDNKFIDSSILLSLHFKDEGKHTIKLSIRNKNNCINSVEKNIIIKKHPDADFSINNIEQCYKEQNFMITDNSSITNDSIAKWYWRVDTTSTAPFLLTQGGSFRLGKLKPGKWNIQLITLSSNQCADTISKAIRVLPSPKAYFSINDTNQCENEQLFEFTNTSSVKGDSISDLLWIIGTDTFSHSHILTFSHFLPGTLGTELIVTTTNLCSDTALRQISVFPSPKADFSINDSVQCVNENIFSFANLSGLPNLTGFAWGFGDGTTSTDENPTKVYTTFGTYEVRFIATSTDNCPDTVSKTIIVHPSPKANFSINDTAQCENEQLFEFTNTSTVTNDTISELIWILGADSIRNQQSEIRNNLKPGICNLELIVTTTNLCSDTALRQITVHPSPKADFSIIDSTQCLNGNRFYLINASTIASGTMNYLWTFGDSSGLVMIPHPLKTYSNWGKYEVQLIVSSDHNCTDTFGKSTYVFPMPLAAFIYLNNCLEDTMYFYDKSTIDSGNIAQWLWDFKNGNQSTLQNPWQIYSDSGQKAVTLVSTSDFGCSCDTTRYFFIEAHVTEPLLERATIENNETVLIEWRPPKLGNPMTYHLERSIDGTNWQLLKDENHNTFSYLDPQAKFSEQPYYYRINATDSCEYTGEYSNIGKTIYLTADTNDLFPVLTWTPYELWVEGVVSYALQVKGWGDFQTLIEIPQSAIPNPQSAISQVDSFFAITGKDYCYRVIAYRTGDSLQSISNEVCIPTAFRLFVPNAFTPNNDGINDIFMPMGIYIKEYQMQIYNRWGEKLFESDDFHKGWNGKYQEEYCPTGVYYYQIIVKTAEGKNKRVSGSLHLLR